MLNTATTLPSRALGLPMCSRGVRAAAGRRKGALRGGLRAVCEPSCLAPIRLRRGVEVGRIGGKWLLLAMSRVPLENIRELRRIKYYQIFLFDLFDDCLVMVDIFHREVDASGDIDLEEGDCVSANGRICGAGEQDATFF